MPSPLKAVVAVLAAALAADEGLARPPSGLPREVRTDIESWLLPGESEATGSRIASPCTLAACMGVVTAPGVRFRKGVRRRGGDVAGDGGVGTSPAPVGWAWCVACAASCNVRSVVPTPSPTAWPTPLGACVTFVGASAGLRLPAPTPSTATVTSAPLLAMYTVTVER